MSEETNVSKEVVQRHEIADYLNVGTNEERSFALMGVGFTSLGESPNAQSKTKKYINEKSSTTNVNSYQPQFDFEADQIKEDRAVQFIYGVGRNEKTGSGCITQYVRVELWNPVKETPTEGGDPVIVKNTFTARLFNVAVVVSKMDGEDDQVISGSLNAQGDFVDGTFNTETREFTPTTAAA